MGFSSAPETKPQEGSSAIVEERVPEPKKEAYAVEPAPRSKKTVLRDASKQPEQSLMAQKAMESVEKAELILEDIGIFPEDVLREIARLTGRTISDVDALRGAVMHLPSFRDGQRVKALLERLGAKVTLRRKGEDGAEGGL
jgi:hypothetical protein